MLKRIVLGLLVVVLAAAAIVGGYLYARLSPFDYEAVTDDVFVIHGFGGNVAVLRTDEGAVVVDSLTFPFQGEWIRELAEELGGGPVQAVINTHYHQDHTHGNPAFQDVDTIVATENTRRHLLERDGAFWEDQGAGLPNDTFTDDHVMEIGGKTIMSMHRGRGHTDGDLVVLFVDDRVLHTGDLLFHERWPNIDLEAGASIPLWIETLDAIIELGFDRVIPGHGDTTDRDGIRAFQKFLRELWTEAQAAVAAGKTLEETRASMRLETARDYVAFGVPFVFRLDRDFVVGRAWEEAMRAAARRSGLSSRSAGSRTRS